MKYLYGGVQTESMKLGKEAHEKLIEGLTKTSRKAIWKNIYTKLSYGISEFLLITEYKNIFLMGRPDLIFFINGVPAIICEFKFSKYQIPFRSYHVQAQIYGLLLRESQSFSKELLFRKEKSILTIDNVKIFIYKFNPTEAEKCLNWALEFWKGERKAIPTKKLNKCKSCEYNTKCD